MPTITAPSAHREDWRVHGTTRVAGSGRVRRLLLPYLGRRRRRPPQRTTTWWAFAMYCVVLIMGSTICGLMLAVFMDRAGASNGYPIATLASIIPAIAALLLVLLQAWDLVQVARYKQPIQILPPLRRGLSDAWWAAIVLGALAGGFVFGKFLWG